MPLPALLPINAVAPHSNVARFSPDRGFRSQPIFSFLGWLMKPRVPSSSLKLISPSVDPTSFWHCPSPPPQPSSTSLDSLRFFGEVYSPSAVPDVHLIVVVALLVTNSIGGLTTLVNLGFAPGPDNHSQPPLPGSDTVHFFPRNSPCGWPTNFHLPTSGSIFKLYSLPDAVLAKTAPITSTDANPHLRGLLQVIPPPSFPWLAGG